MFSLLVFEQGPEGLVFDRAGDEIPAIMTGIGFAAEVFVSVKKGVTDAFPPDIRCQRFQLDQPVVVAGMFHMGEAFEGGAAFKRSRANGRFPYGVGRPCFARFVVGELFPVAVGRDANKAVVRLPNVVHPVAGTIAQEAVAGTPTTVGQ